MRNVSAWRRNACIRRETGDQQGFTLVELMITLAVAAILMTIAVPSFRRITLSNRLSTAAGDVVVALNTARMEAIKRNGSVQFCSDSASDNSTGALGTGCNASAGAVIALDTVNGESLAAPIRDGLPGITAPVQFKGSVKALRFNAQGMAFAVAGPAGPFKGTVADICTAALSSDNHRVITMAGGSVLQTTTTTGTCS